MDKFRALDYAYNHWLETRFDEFEDEADPEKIAELTAD